MLRKFRHRPSERHPQEGPCSESLSPLSLFVLVNANLASATPIALSQVGSDFIGFPIPIIPFALEETFKVGVSGTGKGFVLTDFTVQVVLSKDDPEPRATVPNTWRPAPGWTNTQQSAGGFAHFEARSPKSGIAPGAELDGFRVATLGLIPRDIVVTDISQTAVPTPEPSTMVLVGPGLVWLGRFARRRRRRH